MRTRVWTVAAVGIVIAAAGCSRQETLPTRQAQSTPIAVGDRAPSFSLRSASGGIVSLSDYARKPVLLYFSMGPG